MIIDHRDTDDDAAVNMRKIRFVKHEYTAS